MEHRPSPPVTIEGGSGWQLDAPPADALVDVDPDAVAARRAVVVLVALLVAAALATLLADARGAAVPGGGSPLEVRVDDDVDGLRARPLPAAAVDRADGVRVRVAGWTVADGTATVDLEALNDAGAAVTVEAVQPSSGLSARLLTADGAAVAPPLVLPPGTTRLVGELAVVDCARLTTDGRAWTGGTLVELRLAGDIGSAFFGTRYPLLSSLEAAACPDSAR